jgi:hypothetical protein
LNNTPPSRRALVPKIRERLNRDLDAIPTRIAAEHFAKVGVLQELFGVAKEFDSASLLPIKDPLAFA